MSAVTFPYPTRLERLTGWLDESGLECAVLLGADHVTHLTGYARYFGGPAAVVVGRDGTRTLVVALDEAPIARELAAADEVLPYGERGFGLDLDPLAGLMPVVAGLGAVGSARRIGFASELPGADGRLAAATAAELVPAAAELARIRLRKDADELSRIAASYELCWIAHAAVGEAAVAGASEIELFAVAQSAALLAAGTPIEFLSDLLSGPNAAEVCGPIRVPGRRALVEGDGVVADLVIRCNGYWGDTAETHPVGAAPDIRAARDALYAILRSTAERLVPGASGPAVFTELSERILDAFPGGEFPHHAGHGVGLGCFDDPHVIPADPTPFEAGMVLAIEPGVYFPGHFGARVEEIFVVTPAAASSCERPSVAMQPDRIHHTGYTVSDLDRSVAFYRDLLGCEVIATQEKQGGYLAAIVGYPDAHVRMAHLRLPGGDHVIELFEYLAPRRGHADVEPRNVGASHLCLVTGDLAGDYERLRRGRRLVRQPARRGGHGDQRRRLRSLPS